MEIGASARRPANTIIHGCDPAKVGSETTQPYATWNGQRWRMRHGALESACAETCEGLVDLVERIAIGLSNDAE